MNKSKKLTAAVAASAVASALVAPAAFAATTLTDIDGSFAKEAIKELVDKGIINGKGDGKFDPTGRIERQDFAIILAKALNLDVAAAPATATFTDVPTTDYSFKYVEAAVKAGLIKGNGDGTFGNGSNLSRQDMAALFVRALGNDVTGKGKDLKFSDAGEIADYAKDAVAVAVELGLIAGNGDGTFNPNGNAERQAVALVASKFLKAKEAQVATLTGATVVDNKTVTLTFSKALEALKAEDVAVAAKASGAAVNVTAVTLSEDKKSATVNVTALAAGTTYTATVGGKTVEFTTAAKAEVTAVTAINLKQIKVEFNSAVDKITASDLANYTLEDASVDGYVLTNDLVTKDSASLQADGKTVIITLDNAATTRFMKNQRGYKLTVSGVNDANGVAVDESTKAFTAFDNAVPTAKEVAVVGPNSLKVTFSAPVQATSYDQFSLDGNTVSVDVQGTVGKISGTTYSVVLNVGADLSEGEHKLTVTGVTGYNGLAVDKTDLTFNYAKDTAAPTVSVSSIDLVDTGANTDPITSEVTFKFSEPVLLNADSTLANAEIYAVYNNVEQYKGANIVATATASRMDSNGSQYADTFTATFKQVFPTGNVNFFVNNVDENNTIEDTWSNAFVNAAVVGKHEVDTVKPVVQTVKFDADAKNVVLTFSEALNVASAEKRENYTFLTTDGKAITATGFDGSGHPVAKPVVNNTDKTVTIPAANLPAGKVSLKLTKLADTAVPTGNVISDVTLSLDVADTQDAGVDKVLYTDDQKAIFVYFNKAMDVTSITDLSNFSLGGTLLSKISGVTATAINNNSAVKFTFAKPFSIGTFGWGHLKDGSGKFIPTMSDSTTMKPDAIQATTDILNLKAIANDTFTFEVKQHLSNVDFKQIEVYFENQTSGVEEHKTAARAYSASAKVDGGTVDGTLVTVKLPVDVTAAQKLYTDASNFVKIVLGKDALKNLNGNGLDTLSYDLNLGTMGYATTTSLDKIAPYLVTDKVFKHKAKDATNTYDHLTEVDVTFSEALRVSTIGKDSFTVSGYSVKDVQPTTYDAATGSAKSFRVLLVTNAWNDTDYAPSITLAKDAQDLAGNSIKASSKSFTVTADPTQTW